MESLVLLPVVPAVGLRPPVLLRLATFADVDAVAAMHRRCSAASRYRPPQILMVLTNALGG